MSTVIEPGASASPAMVIPMEACYRLTVEQYHEMAERGILTPEDRVELVEGLLVRKMTIYPPHAYAVHKLNVYFQTKNIPGWIFRSQLPITLADGEPEPDGALVRGVADDYAKSHPRGPHVSLVIEVSDTSLVQDRGVKKRSCARAGIPAYWIVNIPERALEVCSDPVGEDYRTPTVYRTGQKAPVVLAGATCAEFEVSSLFVD